MGKLIFQGCTALWLACHGGHLETVRELVQHGADVDAQDNRKCTPLMIAYKKGMIDVSTLRPLAALFTPKLFLSFVKVISFSWKKVNSTKGLVEQLEGVGSVKF